MAKMQIQRSKHQIDATGKTAGRLATEIATILIGKHKPTYQPNWDMGDFVEVSHVDKMVFSGKKIDQKMHHSHSGYLGGLKLISIRSLLAKNPGKILSHAVSSILPKNNLRTPRLKRLIIKK